MADLTPEQFIQQWEQTELKERASAQSHFESVCRLVGHPLPHEIDPKGESFTYEYGIQKLGGGQGYADVWYDGHFAIEYKGKGKYKDLEAAYRQLLQYSQNLNNPPLLIVCDIENWEIHTNFNNAANVTHRFRNQDIIQPRIQRFLHAIFEDPYRLHPNRTTAQVTADAANVFKSIADHMRGWQADPQRIAHFLTKLVFCLFAEDTGLLPVGLSGYGIFTEIVKQSREKPSQFQPYMQSLFKAMADGGDVLMQEIPWFNGALFDDVSAESLVLEALIELETACKLDWSAIEPAIFGTLFERSLDPSKRGQLGAHYTSRDDIMLIVEPVLMQPLRREWEAIRQEAELVRAQFDTATSTRDKVKHENTLKTLREQMLKRLREIKILDPACGSGNFLYVSLQLLMDLEKAVIIDPVFGGLTMPMPGVHPQQLFGIEIDPIAHDLASIVVWIGYIQWRQNNGYLSDRKPILEDLHENICQMDSIMTPDGAEPDWPEVDVIVGNPPFLGTKKLRGELGDEYVEKLHRLYSDRIPGFSDLVCYWFEKAREHIESGKAKRAGLLATNSIRLGENRRVLERIKASGDIFWAYSDRRWILDGAAVNISIVGFDNGAERTRFLDGENAVAIINADLSKTIFNIQDARPLKENESIAFLGDMKGGSFDISNELAQEMLRDKSNSENRSNSDVLKRTANANDVTDKWRNYWIIDFGVGMSLAEAQLYRKPYEYVEKVVKPEREQGKPSRSEWWLHMRPGVSMRQAITPLPRHIATPALSKHRLFVWFEPDILSNHALVLIARSDDYFFGVLHSHLHEVWSLHMGTSLQDRPRYTPTTTFETFPFPYPPGQENTSSPAYQAIAAAAKQLHEERAAWLNENDLRDRTLTSLYNALNVWRGKEAIKTTPAAGDFAPRLDELHNALDKAVCEAYGWPLEVLHSDEEILRRLLELNLQRSGV